MFDYEHGTAPWYSQRDSIIGIVIEDGINVIGDYAFEECDNLVSVTIPDSLYGLGYYAISGCDSLEELTIPGPIRQWGSPMIYDCSNLHVYLNKDGYAILSTLRQYNTPYTIMDKDSDFIYVDDESISAYLGTSAVVIIPDDVTRIYNECFSYDRSIEKVIIPESVTTIESNAFTGCSSLTDINLPNSVMRLGSCVFQDCTSLESITVPSSLNSLDYGTFSGCTGLKEVFLPLTFSRIFNSAFADCQSLKNVYFSGTEEAKSRIIIDNEDGINQWIIDAEWTCEGNESDLMFCGNNATWSLSSSGILTVSGSGDMFDYEHGTAPWYSQRDSIIGIIVEDGINVIGDYAFEECDNLVSVTIPDSLYGLGYYAISGCDSLEELTIPGPIRQWGSPMIYDCSNLHVYLNKDGYAILSTLRQYNTPYTIMDKDSDFIYVDDESISAYLGTSAVVIIPDDVTRIYNECFSYDRSIEKVIIPESVTTIESNAFTGCSSLTDINLPNSVMRLGSCVFQDCTSLESITVPSSLNSLDYGTFSGCTGLKEVFLPLTFSRIFNSAFADCQSLKNVYFSGTEEAKSRIIIDNEDGINQWIIDAEWTCEGNESDLMFCGNNATWSLSSSGILTVSGSGDMFDYEHGTAPWYSQRDSIIGIIVEDGINVIGDYAFEECDNLVSVTIPDSLYGLGYYAISGCDSLEELTIPGPIRQWGSPMIYDCSNLHVYLNKDGYAILSTLRQYNTPYTIMDKDSDFIYVDDESISAYLGTSAVVIIPGDVTRIYNECFSYDRSIEKVIIPESVTTIESDAFTGCSSLIDVNLPNSITQLGYNVFQDCTHLESVIIPSSLNSLNSGFFDGCTELKRIYLPSGFARVDSRVFHNCTTLTDVFFAGSEEKWNSVEIYDENESLDHAVIHFNDSSSSVSPVYVSQNIVDDTVWNNQTCTYVLQNNISIKQGASLLIGPGVRVEGNGFGITVFGSLKISSATLNKTSVSIGYTSEEAPASFVMTASVYDGGGFLNPTGNPGHAHIEITNSRISNTADYSYIWYPIDVTYITGNTFTNCGRLSIGSSHDVFIYNNVFNGHSGSLDEDAVIEDWAQYDDSNCYVRFNKFNYDGIVLKLPPCYDTANMVADHNCWFTNKEDIIQSRIFDYNDDFSCSGTIEYLPVINEEGKVIETVQASETGLTIIESSAEIKVMGKVVEDTVWNDERVYRLTGDIQIKQGAMLKIDSGVQVEGNGFSIIINGSLKVTSATLNKTSILIGYTSEEAPASFIMTGSAYKGGGLLNPTGNPGHAHIEIRNNKISNTANYSYIWYPVDITYITGNTFTNCGRLSIGSSHDVFIYNNVFNGHSGFLDEDAVIEDWTQYNNSNCYVRFNRFNYDGIVLKLPPYYDTANMVADYNEWNTNDLQEIANRIYDYNDDYNCSGVIKYTPILNNTGNKNIAILPKGLKQIEKEAFANTDFVMIYVPEQCTMIDERAFAECSNLLYISIPKDCAVSPNAFENSPNVIIGYY